MRRPTRDRIAAVRLLEELARRKQSSELDDELDAELDRLLEQGD